MPRYPIPFLKTLSQLLFLLVLYSIFRLLFFAFNQHLFSGISTAHFLYLLRHGLRFDVSAIISINCIFIFWSLLPYGKENGEPRQKILRPLFVTTNTIAILFEIADWAYFPFNHKRSTADVLNMVSRKGDFFNLLPGFVIQYWYLFFIAIAVAFSIHRLYGFIDRKLNSYYQNPAISASGKSDTKRIWALAVVGFALAIIGQRGGIQLIPINLRNAIKITSSKYTPILLNTPFSIINSIGSQRLQEQKFMPQAKAEQLIQPIKQYANGPFKKKNVVVIILESFSREFTGMGDGISYTPFLDSLSRQGMSFVNSHANGLRSAEGLPAILSGIPSLMEEPFTTSIYSTNKITSISGLLKAEGYHTSFYHGATNGSMSFDVFTRSAGIDRYYGRTEYNNDKDYDGNWGIYDEPFLRYFAAGLNNTPQPFFSTVFTLSSHPPYSLPAKYKGIFPKGKLDILPCVGYTDHALKLFFEHAAKQSWYSNTLFIITADHCSPTGSTPYYASGAGRYEIPIIFYSPSDKNLKGSNDILLQQIDILPSVMQYLGYNKPFFSLGNSAFDSTAKRFVINDLSNIYEWIGGGYRLSIGNDTVNEAYNYPADKIGKYNIADSFYTQPDARETIQHWQALVQIYTQSMVENQMSAAEYRGKN